MEQGDLHSLVLAFKTLTGKPLKTITHLPVHLPLLPSGVCFRPFSYFATMADSSLEIMESIPVPPVCSLRIVNMNKYNTLRTLHTFWTLRQTTVAYIYLVFHDEDPNDLLLDEYRIKDFYHMFLSSGSVKAI